jgi:HK97 family phage prohead protease
MNKPQHGTIEQRTALAGSIRADDSKFQIIGIAAAYNVLSQNLGGFKERIMPGAFSRSLREGADVKCLFNHDPSKILGRTKSKTLLLADSLEGLRFACQLDRGNTDHVNVYAAIKRGDLSECSFAFTVPDNGDSWAESDLGDPQVHAIRTLRDVDCVDVSVVAYPAYAQGTQVGARAKAAAVAKSKRFGSHISVEAADGLRKHQCAVIGEQIAAEDQRALTAANVSSIVRGYMTGVLTKAMAGLNHKYLQHNDTHCYGVPENVFDEHPDMEDQDALRKSARYMYGINEVGDVVLSDRYVYESNPAGGVFMPEDVEENARRVFAELREASRWKKRMRGAAGIFVR